VSFVASFVVKIIFSRKGFDAAHGGRPSPALPGGRLVSLPIPDDNAATSYQDIRAGAIDLGTLVGDLTGGRIRPAHTAHLDPDLDPASLSRDAGWRPLFGQAGAAQGHLANQGVGPGDLFLFFGWFQAVESVNNRWAYRRDSADVHALFGWLQVERIISVRAPVDVPPWARAHPHARRPEAVRNNTLYLSTRVLRLPDIGEMSLPGAGLFPHYLPRLQLTKPGRKRSVWELPGWCFPRDGHAPLTYHGRRQRWQRDGERVTLQTVGRGQEFVLDTAVYPAALPWLQELLQTAH
jgi:hypothetical protein